jgi:subtilase family serine protease
MSRFGFSASSIAVLALSLIRPLTMNPQATNPGSRARTLITQKIDESKPITLSGNTRSQANLENDRGPVADDFPMDHMLLQLRRSPEQEQALEQLIDDLHDSKSPNFHHWLTASQFGQTYGPAQADIQTITRWLQSHGFTVNAVYPSGMTIDFSGTARNVREAFHTEIHYLDVNGERHIANMSDPEIPVALAPATAGVVSLNDFRPRPMNRPHANYTIGSGSSASQALAPADLATIYNLNPLFSAGNTGQGQTIAVIEDSDLYSDNDWNIFRAAFGLSNYSSGSLTTVHPALASGGANCRDPGVVGGDDGEAISDAEWASAAAPNAAIMVAACADTRTTFGGLIAMQNLLNASAAPPAIMSLSYGECEAENGESANAAFLSTYQQAAAEGVSVFVAAGDEGAASCDAGANVATHGIGVSAYASTPYNVAMGGTDFDDTLQGTNNTYWSSTNSSNYGSALSYIPEIPWNDSCASSLLAGYFGYSTSYGAAGFCSSSIAKQQKLLEVVAGSGGPSGCATGAPSASGIVGGACQGYAKPSWQSGVPGIPNDGVRDLPDLALFSGDGLWGHYYVTCWSDIRAGGAACTGDPSTWGGGGGTSFSAPIMAGIQALVNQNAGGPQGNPNYVYYRLAANQYGLSLSTACNSAAGNGAGSGCMFYNVSLGDIDVNCAGTQACYGSASPSIQVGVGGGRRGFGYQSVTDGALSVSSQSYSPAYGAGAGWNFATGIGSVNAYNLVNNWSTGQ